jgi:hypothetical protein
MFSHRFMLSTIVVLSAVSPLAHATSPAELYALPVPQACVAQLGPMGLLIRARDQGISAQEAQARLRNARPDLQVSEELVANVFDYPELGTGPLERYTLWSCHARAHGIRPLPLKNLAADMRDCYAKSLPRECALSFQNRMTGLPDGYRPGSFIAPTPAPSGAHP